LSGTHRLNSYWMTSHGGGFLLIYWKRCLAIHSMSNVDPTCNPLHVQCGPNAQSTPCPMWAQRAIHPIIRRVFHAPTICPGIQLDLALPSRPTPRRFWLSGLARPSRTPPGLRLTQGTPILCPEPIVPGYTKHALFTLRQLHCSILSHLSH
jgi:hypothetical protein